MHCRHPVPIDPTTLAGALCHAPRLTSTAQCLWRWPDHTPYQHLSLRQHSAASRAEWDLIVQCAKECRRTWWKQIGHIQCHLVLFENAPQRLGAAAHDRQRKRRARRSAQSLLTKRIRTVWPRARRPGLGLLCLFERLVACEQEGSVPAQAQCGAEQRTHLRHRDTSVLYAEMSGAGKSAARRDSHSQDPIRQITPATAVRHTSFV